ncbi:MAG: type II toxin-antitoxin system RelE/ParE family toxin, partial [Methylococcales bacterium]|nr:type II toxin-antitoxin system RelE/ParE family toxin [Methylococcales bacterium]
WGGLAKVSDRILVRLNNAEKIEDMNYSGAKLHKLEPKKDNHWAVSISGNYRITFKFEEGDASKVNYVDYH